MVSYVRNREELEHFVVTMNGEGWGIRALTRHFQIGRNTVRKILRENKSQRENGGDALGVEKAPRKSKIDPFIPLMKSLLEDFPGITGIRMHEELRDAGYDGGSTIVFDRLKTLRPHPKREPVVRFETEPGEQGQMDWSLYTVPFAKEGKMKVLCFSYVLGFSRRHYVDFTLDRKFHTLIRRHQDAFEYFGGVPRHCLYDGEKTILLRWEAGRPVYNPAFISFITHYRCKPVGCRAGRPQTKGKVEAPFSYIEKNLLNGRSFQDLDDLRTTAKWWLREKSDLHVHDTTGRPPLDLFLEQEKNALLPLPRQPYDTSEVFMRVCRCDGFLEYEANFYSAPFDYVAEILAIKVDEHEIHVYGPELELVARHERRPRGAGIKVENPEHRLSRSTRHGLEPIRGAFLNLGESAESFLNGLEEKNSRNAGFHARFILNLKEPYHTEDVNLALDHAARYHAFDCKAIERILRARAKPRTLESIRKEKANATLEKTLPKISQRPLGEYCELLKNKERTNEE